MQEYGWQRIATIHQNQDVYILSIEYFSSLLKAANFTLVTSETIIEDPRASVEHIKQNDAKIVFLSMFEDRARKKLCEAYKQGVVGTGYVWFVYGWYRDQWWTVADDIECTVEEMAEMISSTNIFALNRLSLSTKEEVTIAGFTSKQLEFELRERMKWEENSGYTFQSDYVGFGYDAAWAVGLMLNKSVEVLKNKVFANGEKRRLEDFTYGDSEMGSLFADLLSETDFVGMSVSGWWSLFADLLSETDFAGMSVSGWWSLFADLLSETDFVGMSRDATATQFDE
ncbi:gamma-aminobutyric acid type B receptor subunit 1-like [Amphiura filiformis]|uniref:gamma-aminobutyric acid type B receptor subunit 1-like n=1 Tax=Amphiura filiformis TaxID=82378 RepID=UPI003B21C41B